jgi:hypothetical protein
MRIGQGKERSNRLRVKLDIIGHRSRLHGGHACMHNKISHFLGI